MSFNINSEQFYHGDCFDAYRYLGAFVTENGTLFRTYAPKAKSIAVIGEFSKWEEVPMKRMKDWNFWEVEIEDAKPGQMYKLRIEGADGRKIDHCDPYGRRMELRPAHASIICRDNTFTFTDEEWMNNRKVRMRSALNIYEMHMGSWKKKSDVKEDWYNYEELAPMIIPYLKENGYNYIEVMPLSEHPSDESWGYLNTGFYAVTARYGTPEQLKYFINECHKNGIGIIMDFVPVHFAVDDYALWHFDGTPLYEYEDPSAGISQWGSNNFNLGKGEVRSFLNSNANYWLNEFHFDGLRMDAISNLIYWQGNKDRGENQGALEFIRNLNSGLKARHPSALLIAEDSSDYQGVTKPVFSGGLGFDYKWDLGWMNDTLKYFSLPGFYRNGAPGLLDFSMLYFYSENFILPFSHDEVVHGKATILQKMDGDYESKWPQARALYLYMYCHPGKKLNFMGNEIGQLREWDESREQDWDMLTYPKHDEFHRYMMSLNKLYLNTPALFYYDYDPQGFEWKATSSQPCTFAFERRSDKQRVLAVFNFSGQDIPEFTVDEYAVSKITEIMNSNVFGGDPEPTIKKGKKKGDKDVIKMSLKAYSGRLFEITERKFREPKKETAETKTKATASKKAPAKKTTAKKTAAKKASTKE
ncbi:MAG: 1,4-alpha-glucan branching protein GlgB [Clostridia bacterium]|nr:1,4-alpha-glucan branching protein GlgB [Clostridia bacterium]